LVLGIGIDIIEIRRISKAMDNPVFMDRIYTPGEQEYLRTRKNNPSTAAGYFAAKEAAAKALGTGFGRVKWTEIEIVREENGKPCMKLYGNAKVLWRIWAERPSWYQFPIPGKMPLQRF